MSGTFDLDDPFGRTEAQIRKETRCRTDSAESEDINAGSTSGTESQGDDFSKRVLDEFAEVKAKRPQKNDPKTGSESYLGEVARKGSSNPFGEPDIFAGSCAQRASDVQDEGESNRGTANTSEADVLHARSSPDVAHHDANVAERKLSAAVSEFETDPAQSLLKLVQSAKRQEKLLATMCAALQSMDAAVDRLASAQENLSARVETLAQEVQAPAAEPEEEKKTRGNMVTPPAKRDGPLNSKAAAKVSAEETEKLRRQDLAKQAEERAKNSLLDEKRKREAEQRRLQEEQKREVEARKHKESLLNKKDTLMSGLLGGGSNNNDLFGATGSGSVAKKKGIFDD